MPYTYLIGWSNHKKYYYGVAYRKGCEPSDLWTKYFTSSKHVSRFRVAYGEPDVIQVRRVFKTALEARNWEIKVIRRINACQRKDFLNQHNPGGRNEKFLYGKGRTNWLTGTKGMGLFKNPYKGVTGRYSDEQRKLISDRTKEAMANVDRTCYEKRDSCQNRRWMNKDGKHKRVPENEISTYENAGWYQGRLLIRDELGRINGTIK